MRRMRRAFGVAGETLMTEIRGREFYPAPIDDDLTVVSTEPLEPETRKEPETDSRIMAEREMIARYKMAGLL